ncbi:hypothetical protein [Nocardia arthritidis]|uniref:Ig-like domain-containing protein n=1 Tax=Nocardia arthritidis TaxID=228602 RepID=A0A6G9Y9I2_9NOCA|nr:hypothetical protein [Nocardia arthritidis]QIS09703.1 hypothetical protein F5544_09010 [Nocardia arthritidis]
MINSRLVVLTTSAFCALAWVPLAGTANAAVVLACDETGTVTWDGQGIGASPAKVHWTDKIKFGNCTGTAVDQGQPTPVSETDDGTETASCGGETTDNTSKGTITWSDGSTSEVGAEGRAKNKDDGSRPGVFPTRIRTGNYQGKTATDVNAVTPAPGQKCPGMTSAALAGTFTITD